jgi:ribosomal protein L32E
MANFEKESFKFPDELEDDAKNITVEVEEDEIIIEVEDDTPPEDRNIDPLPESLKEELETVDKSKEYSRNVKEKFTQYKKAWHEERRAKEEAYREQKEALDMAQNILEENKRLKGMLHSGEKELISTYQNSAEMEVEKAKRNYKEAYDSGDSDRMMEAQEEMISARIKLDKAKNFQPITLQESGNDVKLQVKQNQQPAQMDPKVAAWVSNNQWFVSPSKKAMRKYAEGVHEELEETYGRGYIGTDEYFNKIDTEVKRRFPEEFADTQNDEDDRPQRTKNSTVVAPARRSTSSKRIVLTKSQMSTIKKLGISPEQYYREQQKLES